MKTSDYNRRTFIKNSIGAGVALAGLRINLPFSPYDAKGLPTAVLGKTGVRIPRMAIGLGSRFCNIENDETATSFLNYALDQGLYYWDTAHIYENKKNGVISEVRIGNVVKYRRKEIFLSTKVTSRDPDEAMRQIELSLKRLQTDKLDMLKIHDIQSMADVDKISEKGNLIDILHRMKSEGVTRFIGFSGHSEALAMKAMADRGDFDSMLMAMNHWGNNAQNRQELAIPAAQEQKMGIMLMKVVRPKEKIADINASELVRYALSLKGPSGIVVGMETKDVLDKNLAVLKNFNPMTEDEMKAMAVKLEPFFNHQGLDWMQHGYSDGLWV